MMIFEMYLDKLLEDAKKIEKLRDTIKSNKKKCEWINDVQIFYDTYLKNHPSTSIEGMAKKMEDALFFEKDTKFDDLQSYLSSIRKNLPLLSVDQEKLTTKNSIKLKENISDINKYDVFISHANKDKEDLVDALYQSLKLLGINIFYDKESLEWGDKWKDKILEGTKKAEFAIIVISENFFDREWTEKELKHFLNRQNKNGQKLILPILHNITLEELGEKYPSLIDIQAISSEKYTCDQIALLFAKQLIQRLKNK